MKDYKSIVTEVMAAVESVTDAELKKALALRILEDALLMTPRQPATEGVAPSVATSEPGNDWAQQLANEAKVPRDAVLCALAEDQEGKVEVITSELGAGIMETVRNTIFLYLWVRRLLYKEIYVTQAEATAQVKRLGQNPNQVTNAVRGDPNIQQVKLGGKKMLQLKGDWRQRATAVLSRSAE